MLVGIAFRLYTFDEAGLTVNPTLLETEFIIWSKAELDFSIIAATMPTLRRFVSGFATSYGNLDMDKVNSEASYELRSYGQSHTSTASTLKSTPAHRNCPVLGDEALSTRRSSLSIAEPTCGYEFPWDATRNPSMSNVANLQATGEWNRTTGNDGISASHVTAQDSTSVVSSDSHQMIIKKDVAWTVEHGPKIRGLEC